jgi:hypothetical protein
MSEQPIAFLIWGVRASMGLCHQCKLGRYVA